MTSTDALAEGVPADGDALVVEVGDEQAASANVRAVSAAVAARVNNLVDDVRRVSDPEHLPSNPVLRELVVRPAPVVAEELTDRIVNEALIATADFLSVEFLERGAMAALCNKIQQRDHDQRQRR